MTVLIIMKIKKFPGLYFFFKFLRILDNFFHFYNNFFILRFLKKLQDFDFYTKAYTDNQCYYLKNSRQFLKHPKFLYQSKLYVELTL